MLGSIVLCLILETEDASLSSQETLIRIIESDAAIRLKMRALVTLAEDDSAATTRTLETFQRHWSKPMPLSQQQDAKLLRQFTERLLKLRANILANAEASAEAH